MFERSSSYTGVIYNDSSSMAFWVLLILKKRMPPSAGGAGLAHLQLALLAVDLVRSVHATAAGEEKHNQQTHQGCPGHAEHGRADLGGHAGVGELVSHHHGDGSLARDTGSTEKDAQGHKENDHLFHGPPAELEQRADEADAGKHQRNQNEWERESREVVVGISIGDKVLGQRGGVSKVVVRRNRLVRTQVCAVSVGVGVVGLWVADSPKGPSGNVSVGIQVGGSGLDPVELVEREGRDRAGEDNEQQEQGSTGQQQQSEQSVKRSEQHGN
ncbi:hypothetical protein KL909_005121 [Ogataea angusta]|nr:hypothetical protein KL909_005121 [Ogataea angusta]KAG7826919.1 hypothetical protein KL920_005180 [Ogataea angusta]